MGNRVDRTVNCFFQLRWSAENGKPRNLPQRSGSAHCPYPLPYQPRKRASALCASAREILPVQGALLSFRTPALTHAEIEIGIGIPVLYGTVPTEPPKKSGGISVCFNIELCGIMQNKNFHRSNPKHQEIVHATQARLGC